MRGAGKFGLASVCNLDQLPPAGAVVIGAAGRCESLPQRQPSARVECRHAACPRIARMYADSDLDVRRRPRSGRPARESERREYKPPSITGSYSRRSLSHAARLRRAAGRRSRCTPASHQSATAAVCVS